MIRSFRAGSSAACFSASSADELLENASAMLVILKLVEARAGRSQQNRVAGLRALGGDFHGARHRSRALDGNDAAKLRFDLVRGAADQQHHARVPPQRIAQDRVIAAFVLAAQNHQQRCRESIERLERGVHVGGLGIVEIFHAGNCGDEFDAVLHAREAAHALGDRARARLRPASRPPPQPEHFPRCDRRAGRCPRGEAEPSPRHRAGKQFRRRAESSRWPRASAG